jgi:hypothetical protein
MYRAPDKLRICVFYAMKTSKNACIIRSECTYYAYNKHLFYFEIYIKNNNNLERRKTEKSIKRNIMCGLDVIRFWEKTS